MPPPPHGATHTLIKQSSRVHALLITSRITVATRSGLHLGRLGRLGRHRWRSRSTSPVTVLGFKSRSTHYGKNPPWKSDRSYEHPRGPRKQRIDWPAWTRVTSKSKRALI